MNRAFQGSAGWQQRWLRGILPALLMLFAILCLVKPVWLVGVRASEAWSHGYFQLDNEEGALLFQAAELRKGNSIYRPLDSAPYVVGTYTPVFMLLSAVGVDPARPGLTAGRLVSAVSCLGIACLVFTLLWTRTRNVLLSLLSAVSFLATYEVYNWIGYARVDFTAIFFSLAGLALFPRGGRTGAPLFFSAALFALAFYSKQTAIFGGIACCLAAMTRSRKSALLFTGAWLLCLLVPGILLTVSTRGQFLLHTIYYNANRFQVSDLLTVWPRHMWFMHSGWILAAGLCIPPAMLAYRKRCRSWLSAGKRLLGDPILLYSLLAMASWVMIAKSGSAENYLLEPLAGLVLLTGLSLWYLLKQRFLLAGGHYTSACLFLCGAAGLCMVCVHAFTTTRPWYLQIRYSPGKNPQAADIQGFNTALSRVRQARNPWSELALLNLLAGRTPVLQPFIMTELAKQKRWNQAGFVRTLENREYDVIVAQRNLLELTESDVYSAEMIAAIKARYQLKEVIRSGTLWSYYIFQPR